MSDLPIQFEMFMPSEDGERFSENFIINKLGEVVQVSLLDGSILTSVIGVELTEDPYGIKLILEEIQTDKDSEGENR